MAVAAAQKNREMFAIKKSYSIEVSKKFFFRVNNNFYLHYTHIVGGVTVQ